MAGRPREFDPTEVLNRAMNAFFEKGYEGTSLSDLERVTGLGRQSLYGAFGDKRALFSRVVEHYFETQLKPAFIDLLDAPGSALGNIERLLALMEQTALSPEFNGCLVGNSVAELGVVDADTAALLARKLELIEEALVRALRRAQRDGEVQKCLDPRVTARSLLALTQGLALMARVNRDRTFVRSVLQSARQLIS